MRLLILLCFLLGCIDTAQSQYIVKKKGWLFYWSDKSVFLASPFDKVNQSDFNDFFKINKYDSGLLVNYIPEALYFKSVSKEYKVEGFSIKVGEGDFVDRQNSDDTIRVLPVVASVRSGKSDVLGLSQVVGLGFYFNEKKIKIYYSFEQAYDVLNVELLRKKDKRRLRRVKNYTVYPPH